jgi:hypothetical protein
MSTKLGSPDGGKKTKVVLFGSIEGSSRLASYPTIIDASIFCSIVFPVLVSSETTLALWVELALVFWYQSVELMSGTFLPPKRSKGTLVERSNLDLMYIPSGSLGLFIKEKRKNYHWVYRSIHERKQKQKEKLPLGLGEPSIAYVWVLTSCLKAPPIPS